MTESLYHESKPVKLPDSVFRLYQYVVTDLENSPGIMVEDGCSEFMFLKQSDVLLKVEGQPPKKIPRCFSLGTMRKPYKFQHSGKIDLFNVKLQPWVARHFFPNDFSQNVFNLEVFYGLKIREINDDLFSPGSFVDKVKKIEKYFAEFKMPRPESYKMAREICRKIYRSRGIISVKEIVAGFSESRQKINKEFLFQTKYSIKEFAILIRLREAINFLHQHPNISLTELALEFGYFDQSHFIKDIKRVTSVTPTELFSTRNLVRGQLN